VLRQTAAMRGGWPETVAASSHLFLHPSVLDDDERFAALRDALERVRALGVQCAPSRDLVAALG
jgi:uncharacterized protein (DUF1786 family)